MKLTKDEVHDLCSLVDSAVLSAQTNESKAYWLALVQKLHVLAQEIGE